jgi:hypothetical protein
VELTLDGQTQKQTLHVGLDPRVGASQAELEEQLRVARRLAAGMNVSFDLYHRLDALTAAVEAKQKAQTNAGSTSDLEKQIDLIQNGTHDAPGLGPANRDLSRLLMGIEAADERPTEPQMQAVKETCAAFDKALGLWNALNEKLRVENPLGLPVSDAVATPGCGGN